MTGTHLAEIIALAVAAFEILGVVTAIRAIMGTRTSQGAIAWAVSLVTFPFVAVPLYLVFGRNRFEGYVEAMRTLQHDHRGGLERLVAEVSSHRPDCIREEVERFVALERLAWLPFTCGNRATLLVNGDQTFGAIFEAIRNARSYVLLQFYVVRDDTIGRQLRDLLCRRSREGIRVHFLYDEIGSISLPDRYVDTLQAAGVDMQGFKTTRGPSNRFQINFRNHRKIVVVDGRIAFAGGLNVGDEYLGADPRLSPWRDTHLRIEGPAVQCVQASLCADWYWANHETLDADWTASRCQEGGQRILVLPTGPTDDLEACSLMHVHCMHAARKRLWIATPYFVPDEAVLKALKLAALRGVDVRIIIPFANDNRTVHLAAFSYLEEIATAGIQLYWYEPGFMHQKVMLIDDDAAAVGTANIDNRSLRLNFEVTVLVVDEGFAREVAGMLQRDLTTSRLIDPAEYGDRGILFRATVRTTRLLAPIL
jgi:cardiolipin synthase A/B